MSQKRKKPHSISDSSKSADQKGEIRHGATNPTLSLCMIVKNEEKFLPQCLDSVKDYVDEIIIVDTGSTDSTVEIAKRYNAKIYHHAWENSFSKARNYSLKYATCDWVLWFDADEEFEKNDAHKLREVIRDDSVNVIYMPLYSRFDEGRNLAVANSGKIFRNHKGFFFEGIVHNKLNSRGPSKVVDIKIIHHGYNQDKEQMEKKFIRTSTLLKEQIKSNPDNPVPHHYLATSCLDRRKNDECLREALEAERLYELQNSREETRLSNYFTTTVAFLRKNDLDNAEKFALKSIGFYPEYLDGYNLLSTIYFMSKEYGKCFETTNKYLSLLKSIESKPTNALSVPYNTIQHGWLGHTRLAIIYFEQNKTDKGNDALKDALSSTDRKWEPYYTVGRHFFDQNNFKEAEEFFMSGLKHSPHNEDLLNHIVRTYEKLGAFDKAIVHFKRVLENCSDQVLAQYRLGLLLMKDSQFDSAIGPFKSVVEKDPKHIGARYGMGNAYERLGSLHSDDTKYVNAKECFLSILKLDANSIAARIALSKIYIYLNDLDTCVRCCDELLKILNLPRNITIKNIFDVSILYGNIGEALLKQKNELLSKAAFEIEDLLKVGAREKNETE